MRRSGLTILLHFRHPWRSDGGGRTASGTAVEEQLPEQRPSCRSNCRTIVVGTGEVARTTDRKGLLILSEEFPPLRAGIFFVFSNVSWPTSKCDGTLEICIARLSNALPIERR